MKGLYLNVDTTFDDIAFKSDYLDFFELNSYGVEGGIVYSALDWPNDPYFKSKGCDYFIAGWFLLNGELNNLPKLVSKYEEIGIDAFFDIELGNFTLLKSANGKLTVVNDFLGLSTHFYSLQEGKLRVSPSLTLLSKYTEVDRKFETFINTQGHLFDNFTALKNVYRLPPAGLVSDCGNTESYLYINKLTNDFALQDIPEKISELVECWPYSRRALAISGGLDSRLMLASSKFSFGYTYGPEDSVERIIAREFAGDFDRHEEFSVSAITSQSNRALQESEFFFRYSATWIPGLLESYEHARTLAQDADVLFDGYLGDVFQRGNFLKFGGALGSFLKLFPSLYCFNFSPRFILRKRYKNLNDELFHLVFNSYLERTKDWQLNDYQKVTMYELLYGRGARYVINGGNITANQFFTDVPVFMSKTILGTFINSSLKGAVLYKNLALIWDKTLEKYKKLPTDSGLRPSTHYLSAPFVNMGYRLLMHYVPWMGDYSDEIKRLDKKS